MAAQYFMMLRGVRDNDPIRLLAAVKSSVLWMLAMIFTYAIFIPNNWRRAAKLIVPMALAPMAVPWILGLAHPELYRGRDPRRQFREDQRGRAVLVAGGLHGHLRHAHDQHLTHRGL